MVVMRQNANSINSTITICSIILLLTLMACSNNSPSNQDVADSDPLASQTTDESQNSSPNNQIVETPKVENISPTIMSFNISIRENGSPEGGIRTTHKVKKDDTVEFILTTAIAGELHLHAWSLDWHITPGTETTATFPAETTGRYPLEFHIDGSKESGVPAGYIEVHP